MGVEYAVLAIMTSIALIIIVTSSLFLYLHMISESSKIPVLEGSVVTREYNESLELILTMRHLRGESSELKQIDITTDQGMVQLVPPFLELNNSIKVKTLGLLNNKIILPGSTSRVIVIMPRSYFSTGKEYGILIVLDKYTLTLTLSM
jgi:hypothetical protein